VVCGLWFGVQVLRSGVQGFTCKVFGLGLEVWD